MKRNIEFDRNLVSTAMAADEVAGGEVVPALPDGALAESAATAQLDRDCLVSIEATLPPASSEVRVGLPAPEFCLLDQHYRLVRLSSFRAQRIVVLFFYVRDGTPACTCQARGFRDAHECFAQMGATVLGVSADSLTRHRGFAERHQLPFPLLVDPRGDVRRRYAWQSTGRPRPTRATYVIDRDGIVRHIFVARWCPEYHVDEALEAVRRLRRPREAVVDPTPVRALGPDIDGGVPLHQTPASEPR